MKTRPLLIALSLLLGPPGFAQAQVSFDIGFPNVNIGFNLGSYPQLVLIPGSPVYYAPRLNSNFFFYDGLYWVYRDDEWYSSSWYNGPWESVGPQYVPLFVLRVPVRYYRQPPQYFRGWRADAPPRWGQHWGREWEDERSGWNRWDRRSVPAAAPPPSYQRQYRGNEYPRAREQQYSIRADQYRYQPRENVSRAYEEKARRPDNSRSNQQWNAVEDAHPNQQREAPEIRPPQRQQITPTPPQPQQIHPDQRRNAPEIRPPQQQQTMPTPPQQRPPPQQTQRPTDRPDDRDKGNRGNDQRNDQRNEQRNDQNRDRH